MCTGKQLVQDCFTPTSCKDWSSYGAEISWKEGNDEDDVCSEGSRNRAIHTLRRRKKAITLHMTGGSLRENRCSIPNSNE